jgi:hypothetical protein
MGTRSAPRAKAMAKRLHRLRNRPAAKNPAAGVESEIGVESATLPNSEIGAASRPSAEIGHAGQPDRSPAAAAHAWAESIEEQTPIKQVAAAALILGQNVLKTASALGVDRRTIQRWRKLDPEFQLAMVQTKQELIITSRQFILALADTAVGEVEEKLNEGEDARAALALLRNLGVISPQALDPRQYEPVEALETSRSGKKEKLPAKSTSTENEFRAQSATSATEKPESPAQTEDVYEMADLSDAQQVAIQAFIFGSPLAEVARSAQCPESTVRGWLCHDRRFFSVLSDFQFDRVQHMKHRIFALIDRAMQIVKKAIEAKDGRVAMLLLRGLGIMR